jgi:tetratricopeptide (TPR) repeat protein
MFFENSPLSGTVADLKSSDLLIFGHVLKQIVLDKIPTGKDVLFLASKDLGAIDSSLTDSRIRQLRNKLFTQKIPVCLEPDKILLPIEMTDRNDLAIMLAGVDKLLIQSTSTQWLQETGKEVIGQFIEARNDVLDPLTSLYNSAGFRQFMAEKTVDDMFHVVLVESLPPAKSIKDVVSDLSDAARLLEEFSRLSIPLFHLGHSIFCYIISGRDSAFVKSFCRSLTNFARNGGLRKIHIGFSSYSARRHQKADPARLGDMVLSEAWQALHKAGRRGPYAFCDYEIVANPGAFPLQPVPKSTGGKFAYRVKDLKRFSLVFFAPDFKNRESFDELIDDYLGDQVVVTAPQGFLVVRPNQNEKKTEKWAASVIKKIIDQKGERYSLSAGVGSYPFRDYRKSEIVKNCQKALLHGSFFGPGSTVVFDSLSLNVSGDAYFGESDLSTAVKEYSRGLELKPDDVNLLNSLGVAYALMNKTARAQDIFSTVLAIDPKNFMALFNQGLGEKKLGQYAAAVDSFSLALGSYDKNDDDETAVINDLRYHYGTCLYRTGDYTQSIAILEKYHESARGQPGHERCFRYIGMSFYALRNHKKAATWLQRGLSVNQADAESLSLLGMIYMKTGEGDDIALKFCEKSVEIDPDSFECRLRYAQVLAASGDLATAEKIYRSMTRSRKMRAAVWLEMARLQLLRKDFDAARHWLTKIFDIDDLEPTLLREAEGIKKQLTKR